MPKYHSGMCLRTHLLFVRSRPDRLLYNTHKVYYKSKSVYIALEGVPVHVIYTVPPSNRCPHRGPPVSPHRGYNKSSFDVSLDFDFFFGENRSFCENFSFFIPKSVAPAVIFSKLENPIFRQVAATMSTRFVHANSYFSKSRQNFGLDDKYIKMELQRQLKGHFGIRRVALTVKETVFESGGDWAEPRSHFLFQRPLGRFYWNFSIFCEFETSFRL